MIVILMGVSGVGKTTVGLRMTERLGWELVEGDELHPAENVAKMAAGVALTDEDRWPWLCRLHERILDLEGNGLSAVVACSALKEAYRDQLLEGTVDARVVHLRGDAALIAERLERRRGHFFDPALLADQFETLEEPADAVRVEVEGGEEEVVEAVLRALGLCDD